MGHGPALLSTEASGRCRFSQATFAGALGNWRDARLAVIRADLLVDKNVVGREIHCMIAPGGRLKEVRK